MSVWLQTIVCLATIPYPLGSDQKDSRGVDDEVESAHDFVFYHAKGQD